MNTFPSIKRLKRQKKLKKNNEKEEQEDNDSDTEQSYTPKKSIPKGKCMIKL